MNDKESNKLDKQIGLVQSFHKWGTNENKGDTILMLRLSVMHMDELATKIFSIMAAR